MKFLAVVALMLAACANKPSTNAPQLANGRCTCESGALCLQPAGGSASTIVCAPPQTAGLGCAAFTNATRSCWGSPGTSGLCLCSGGGELSAAR